MNMARLSANTSQLGEETDFFKFLKLSINSIQNVELDYF